VHRHPDQNQQGRQSKLRVPLLRREPSGNPLFITICAADQCNITGVEAGFSLNRAQARGF